MGIQHLAVCSSVRYTRVYKQVSNKDIRIPYKRTWLVFWLLGLYLIVVILAGQMIVLLFEAFDTK